MYVASLWVRFGLGWVGLELELELELGLEVSWIGSEEIWKMK